MKKRLLRLILCLVTVFTVAPMAVLVSAETDGYYEYKITDGEATITDCDSPYGDITIPSELGGCPVTSIGYEAFYNCGFKSITIPNSITSIGIRAFEYCGSLTSVTIPNSVTSIGEGAFEYCKSLTSVTIPDSVTSIGSSAFYNTGLFKDKANWENGALYIDNCLIDMKNEYKGDYAIKDGTRLIADDAFSYCESLTSVTIPNSMTNIGDSLFYGCTSLTKINVSEGNNNFSSIDGVLFNKKKTKIICYPPKKAGKSYTIPNSVTSIDKHAFSYCTSLTNITIGNSVTSIGESAFYNCEKLKTVKLGKNLKKIGDNAFFDCDSLTNITIPNSVTTIGYQAFRSCGFKSVTIPDNVKSIGWGAFFNCDSLESITIPDSVTEIGSDTFYWCTSLKTAKIGNSVTRIGSQAFYYCESLKSIRIPNSVTSIGYGAFYNTALYNNKSNWENGVLYIDNCLIDMKSNYTGSYTIKRGTRVIAESALYGSPLLESVTIPDSVISIGSGAIGYYTNDTENTDKAENLTIYGHKGSAAQKYAQENGFQFIDGHKTVTENKKATYFAKGYKNLKVCAICGKVFKKGKTIAKLKLKTPKFTLKKTKKSFKVTYKKVKGATGFQVNYKTGKGKWKTQKFSTKKTATKTIKKLKKGKRYTVKVRAFVKQGKKIAYSNWTSTKKVTVK